jgi:exosortase/archaeosortase family protein
MIRVDRGHVRLVAWLVTTSVLILTLYSSQLFVLLSGLDDLLTSTLGTVFPAYPFLALLVLLTALGWKDFHDILLTERGLTSKPAVRCTGVLLILIPTTLWSLFLGLWSPSAYLAMEISALSLVLVAYGVLLAINPAMWRKMLPYASLYALGLVFPLFMLDTLGAPLAIFSSYIAQGITNALGIHVAWQGVSFEFVSLTGDPISAVVTPACSAVYSISIYLALLGLMYLDFGSSVTTTAKFAIVGVALIPLLDSARIALTIWFGFVEGYAAFWGIHDWLGYTLFLAFYIAVLVVYSRTAPHPEAAESAHLGYKLG